MCTRPPTAGLIPSCAAIKCCGHRLLWLHCRDRSVRRTAEWRRLKEDLTWWASERPEVRNTIKSCATQGGRCEMGIVCQVRQRVPACSEALPVTLPSCATAGSLPPAQRVRSALLRLLLAGGGGVCALLPRRPGGRARRLGRSCCWAALEGDDLAPQLAGLPAGEGGKDG